MAKMAKGPKDVWVRAYARWHCCKRERVRSALRACRHRMRLCASGDQLSFVFE